MNHEHPEWPLIGSKPHQWGRHKIGKQRKAEFTKLVKAAYNAAFKALEINESKHQKGNYQLKNASKVQLVALKRVAEKLFYAAYDAEQVLDKYTQATDENLYNNKEN